MNRLVLSLATAALALSLAACKDESSATLPAPVSMTEEALGHFCQMNLSEHPGPKAQVHLEGQLSPLFFSQVRDAIAYQRMPEQSHRILALYVSDMGAAPSWEDPGIDNWIPAPTAFYVVGSDIIGGMGAPELVPFSDETAANSFAAQYGGAVLLLSQIDDSEVLAPVEFEMDEDGDFISPELASEHYD